MTADELRSYQRQLRLPPRQMAKLLGFGKNGERSFRRMIRGERHIPKVFETILAAAVRGEFPPGFVHPDYGDSSGGE